MFIILFFLMTIFFFYFSGTGRLFLLVVVLYFTNNHFIRLLLDSMTLVPLQLPVACLFVIIKLRIVFLCYEQRNKLFCSVFCSWCTPAVIARK